MIGFVSRQPLEPPQIPEAPPTVIGALLGASLASVLSLVGGFVIWPWAFGRLVVAIRRAHVLRASPAPRTIAAGLWLLVITGAPLLALALASARGGEVGSISAARVIGPVLVGLAVLPLLLRLPLVLAHDREGPREVSLFEAVRRAVVHAVAAPLDSARFAVGLVGVVTLVVGACSALAPSTNALVAVLATLALFPVSLAVILHFLSARTPAEPPRLWPRSLVVLAAFFSPPFLLVVLAGGLATLEPRAATVVTEGRGLQLERGMMSERGPRGSFLDHRFAVEGRPGGVRVVRSSGEETWVATRYDASAAWISREACRDWHAQLFSDCSVLRMRGTDWEMQLLLDAEGRRLDDGALDRAFERVGVLGTVAVLVALGVLLSLAFSLLRVRRTAARLSLRGRRHRLRGTLTLGDGGAIEGDMIVGDHNRVVLDEGGRVLRLPTKQGVLAIEAALRATLSDGRVLPVLVALDTLPSIVAHRAAEAPLPVDAAIVIGDPDAIESDTLVAASRGLSRRVLVGVVLAVASGLAISSS